MKNCKSVLINSEINPNNINFVSGSTQQFEYKIANVSDYTHVIVLACSIPVSYYLIQEGYN